MVFGAMYRDEVSSYDTPLICLNGHVLTTSLQSHPETQSEYCSQCGEKTISKCPSCQEDIRGKHNVPGVVGWGYELPLHCHKCGKQYPWTENRIKAAKDYTDLIDELNAQDKEAFKKDIVAITKNTPEAQVAALRFKKTLAKVGKPVAGAMKEILVDITSESIKKIIWPDK